MKSGMKTIWHDEIIGFGEYDIDAKWDALIEKMEDGWTGFPLLVVETQGDYYALNGPYRLGIAIECVLDVPCYVIAEDDWRAAEIDENDVTQLNTAEKQLRFLQRLGDSYAMEIYQTDDE